MSKKRFSTVNSAEALSPYIVSQTGGKAAFSSRLLLRNALLGAVIAGLMTVSSSSAKDPVRTEVAAREVAALLPTTSSIRVGWGRSIATIAEAARIAGDGALIEVDAGTYRGDVAVWTQRDLRIRAVGGRARLVANGVSAKGKAIWVVRSERMTIEGFDFEDAAVPDRNGAGIRFKRGHLLVRDCTFRDNQSGILAGNDSAATLDVEDSEFVALHPEDGQNHHLYAGAIGRLSVSGSYFHLGAIGHLLKSRAALNVIRYNRLTDETGDASSELEFPNGGLAFVIGNIIQQSARSANPHLLAFGAEGYASAVNELYLVNNTLVDDMPGGGIFIRVRSGAGRVQAINNLWVGRAAFPQCRTANFKTISLSSGRASMPRLSANTD
jgi:hypothetical protein